MAGVQRALGGEVCTLCMLCTLCTLCCRAARCFVLGKGRCAGLGTPVVPACSSETDMEQASLCALPFFCPRLVTPSLCSIKDDKAKRAAMLTLIDQAGREQLMRGRVSSALHGALRGAEESKLSGGRFERGSAGQYITRQQPQQ